MKLKVMRFSYILPAILLGGISVFSGCDDSKSVYNPERIQEEAKNAFPVKDIDPNQTWETSAICKATVSVYETAGEVYTIKVFTANPYNTNGDAALLATSSVANGKTTTFDFDIPAAIQYVYVMKVDSKGYSSAIPVAVESNTIKATFGEGAATTRAATTRASGTFFTPETPGDNIFPTEAPADCKVESSETFEGGGNFLLENKTYEKLQIEDGGNFYIKGNVTIKDWNSPGQVTNFYLLPNATLTLNKEPFNHRENSIISIGSGATLIAQGIGMEKSSQIFNKGNINAKHIIVRSNAYLYNVSNLVAEELTIDVEGAKVCNATDGKMSITSNFKISNGHFLNEDGATADIKTTSISGNAATSSWENAGHYTATDISITSHNEKVKNSCKLEIKDKLIIESGTLLNDGYIESKDLDMSNGLVKMASGSYINITEQADFKDSWESNDSEGFVATDSWAILKMAKARYKNAYHAIAYIGKLYIACDDHFSIGEDKYNPTYKLESGATMTSSNGANISIPASGCNPGYGSTPDGGGTTTKVASYVYAFEDMMEKIGDYDFNDVVLYITVPYEKDGEKVIDVTLKAAGASKQLAVLFNYNGKKQNVFADVHKAFKVSAGTLVNTGHATAATVTTTIVVDSDFNLKDYGDFYISDGKGEIHIPQFTDSFVTGYVPYALRIASSSWKWPKERIQITDAYTDFAKWAQNATEEPNWYDNPVSGKVMN